MTCITETQLHCDREGCPNRAYAREDLGTARHLARRLGWAHRGQQDYCPTHAS